MQISAIRRLQANFCYFSRFSKNLCNSINDTKNKPITESFEGVKYISHTSNVFEMQLNNPKKLNSLDIKMIKSMLKRIRPWLTENEVTSEKNCILEKADKEFINNEILEMTQVPKVIILTGSGDKAFCAGGDITSLYEAKMKTNDLKPIKDFFRYEYLIDYKLTRIKPILISLWNGYVMGGGVGLSINAPIRIATDNTLFAMPETAIGLFPDVGASYFLPRIFNKDPNIGLYMGLTGGKLKGKELALCGVATHFVPKANLENLKKAIIERTTNESDLAAIQKIIQEFAEVTYDPRKFQFPKMNEIKKVFLNDSLHEIFQRLSKLSKEGSDSEKDWSQNVLKNLNNYSLISLIVAFEQIKRGMENISLKDAYNLEDQLISAFIDDSDFFEGVRALLIDKDLKPKWKYKNLIDIKKDDIITKYFEKLEKNDVKPIKEEIENEIKPF